MEYLTGVLALQIPCELDSVGTWNFTKKDFHDDKLFIVRESDDSKLKGYGIEEHKIIPYKTDEEDGKLYSVANHVRAYLDLLCDRQFDTLKDLFYSSIKSKKCRAEIFRRVYDMYKDGTMSVPEYQFMEKEFGNAWFSYVQSRMSSLNVLSDAEDI